MKTRTGRAIDCGARCKSRCVERIDLCRAFGHEADMNRPSVGVALTQPDKHPAVADEAFQVGMTCRAVGTVVIRSTEDPEWRQGVLVKIDGAVQVTD